MVVGLRLRFLAKCLDVRVAVNKAMGGDCFGSAYPGHTHFRARERKVEGKLWR